MRVRVALLVVAIISPLIVASAASADAYWFYQGNLPTSGGARSVQKFAPMPSAYDRVSWTPNTHKMNWLLIDQQGNWTSIPTDPGYYDETIQENGYTQAGCQNPVGLSTVYVNCHVGSGP